MKITLTDEQLADLKNSIDDAHAELERADIAAHSVLCDSDELYFRLKNALIAVDIAVRFMDELELRALITEA